MKKDIDTDEIISWDEYYDSALISRRVDADGNVTEYENEDFDAGSGVIGYGRTSLYYDADNTEYKTYDWETSETRVTVDVYDGVYTTALYNVVQSGVYTTDRTETNVYDHDGENLDLNTGTNGWVLRERTVYGADGVTMNEKYTYHSSGKLETKELVIESAEGEFNGKHVKYYYNDEDAGLGFGRINRIDNETDSWYYTYTYRTPLDPLDNNLTLFEKRDLDDDSLISSIAQTYYGDTGLLHEKTFSDEDEDGNLYYERENSDFYGNGQYGRIIRVQRASDNQVTKTISFQDASASPKKIEHYTALDESVWQDTIWYYASGRTKKTLASDGTAVIYFDVDGSKRQYQWDASNYITYWTSVTNYTAGRARYTQTSSSAIELYEYYSSGNLHYKDSYTYVGGKWTWVSGVWYQNSPGVYGGTGGSPTAPLTLTVGVKPTKADTAGMYLLDEVDYNNANEIDDPIQRFYSNIDEWKQTATGKGVTIALLDTGINGEFVHGGVLDGYNFAGNDSFEENGQNSDYTDTVGHGTNLAGVIKGTNDSSGIASLSDLLAVKIFDNDKETNSHVVAEAIKYSVDMGAKILAMPFTLFPVTEELNYAIDYAHSKGAILIASAGNDGAEISENSLAANDKVITVGSVNLDGTIAKWSNYGSEIDLYAPWDIFKSGSNETGTSYSAAFIAGITALAMEENPDMTFGDVLNTLKNITIGLGDEETSWDFCGNLIEGEELTPFESKEDVIPGVNMDEVLSGLDTARANVEQFNNGGQKELSDNSLKKQENSGLLN
ncbi:Peptidase S8 and S53, subtilisin, kexin, sedolisin domain protein [Candidatus Omnitrophus magneticus]|uniref:Peptidase S8 and S53, subtilisin, kexin, sedolisin domain protein n=1 Tax=Candidatus Omnitrophus magneticus TaxID=1609969 RepID=A0A0F0CQ18_9BACT|nr:Peptidase S8 and S53, subtilisin, kexin, sedolisin domain protein [Candidatus Omnitrophus magneticus]